MAEKNIRIPVNLKSGDKNITVKIEQDFDNLEVLSLKISNADAYTKMCSDFGVIVGRVMLNSGFGVQNARVNIFIPITEQDKSRPEILELYPFETVNDTYPNGVRYNLLPRIRNGKNPSHKAVGNFPHESDFSHYPQLLEITDKYYKYTTTTNESGDYMIFGVPLGQKDIVMDFDVFDTTSFDITANDLVEQVSLNGSISALEALLASSADPALNIITGNTINPNKVPNFIYKGFNNYDVEVKTNLDDMVNIFHEVKQVMVSPFWGDDDFCDVGITRCDFKIDFKYTPTAIFFGYIHSASAGFAIDPDYNYSGAYRERSPEIHAFDNSLGYSVGDIYPYQKMEIVVYRLDDKLNPGSRNRLGIFPGSFYNGIFRVSLPMYRDYYVTNEFGDLVPTTDKTLGIPTKGEYAFEIYDTDDAWTARRSPKGGFDLTPLPGIRIPSTTTGDYWLGGWEGTWTGLFEYDIVNKKRKFYTVKTIHSKHSNQNIKTPGNFVGYFPAFNPNKSDAYWNFPISINESLNYEEPTIIGSVLIPRVAIKLSNEIYESLDRPYDIVSEYWLSPDDTYNEYVKDFEMYLGIGVKKDNGVNSGSVFTDLFKADEFIYNDGNNVFGDVGTWNYGDNSTTIFQASLYAVEKAKGKESNANALNVHKAYNQAVSEGQTYGVFINSVDSTITNKKSVMEILIYDITDELPNLIKDDVYSSYRKGNLIISSNVNAIENIQSSIESSNVEIYIEEDNSITNQTGGVITPSYSANSYKGKFYYFGTWRESNALYDIERNYFIQ
jgi:hypothetical protein